MIENSWPALIYSIICICMWLVPIVIITWSNELFRNLTHLVFDWWIAVSLVYEMRWSSRPDQSGSIEYVLLSMVGRESKYGTIHRTSFIQNSAAESGIGSSITLEVDLCRCCSFIDIQVSIMNQRWSVIWTHCWKTLTNFRRKFIC